MSIIGFNLNKIMVERKKAGEGKININNNISVTRVKEEEIGLGGTMQKTLKVDFRFVSKYEPDMGEILMEGDVLWLADSNNTDIVKQWEATKNLPEDIMRTVLNHILVKCNIEALLLSRDVNLPPPIPLPKVDKKPDQVEQKSESPEAPRKAPSPPKKK